MKKARNIILLLFLVLGEIAGAQDIDKSRLLEDLKFLSSSGLEGRAPLTDGSKLARGYITDRYKKLGLTSQFRDFTQHFPLKGRPNSKESGHASNVVGFIPGANSDEIILVMAHYDHLGKKGNDIFHGADDNASGVSGLLAIAGYFSENRPDRSIIFAATDAEELGLLGARALVKDFPFPLEQIVLVVNMDMISRSKSKELYAVGTRHYPHLAPYLKEVMRGSDIRLVLGKDGGGGEDWTNSSDHAPFHAEGIPFVYFGVDDHEDYHKVTDTFERIDQDFFYNAVKTVLEFIKAVDKKEN